MNHDALQLHLLNNLPHASGDQSGDPTDTVQHTGAQQPDAPLSQRVTEVVLPQAPGVCETLLLPMLEHLSRQRPQRWLTWVGNCGLPRSAFRAYDLVTDRLRHVNPSGEQRILGCARQALRAGTSQAVIVAVSGPLARAQLAELETAAARGDCYGIVLRRWG